MPAFHPLSWSPELLEVQEIKALNVGIPPVDA
jgi:hypothetical protein